MQSLGHSKTNALPHFTTDEHTTDISSVFILAAKGSGGRWEGAAQSGWWLQCWGSELQCQSPYRGGSSEKCLGAHTCIWEAQETDMPHTVLAQNTLWKNYDLLSQKQFPALSLEWSVHSLLYITHQITSKRKFYLKSSDHKNNVLPLKYEKCFLTSVQVSTYYYTSNIRKRKSFKESTEECNQKMLKKKI